MKSLLLLALGLARTVVLGARIEAERIVVSVRPYKREQRRCPVCGRACDFYDMANRGAPRLWRAMDLARSACYLEYAPCRVRCPEHGVRTEAVPWARHGARFTRDFEDWVAWLAVRCTASAVSELARVEWHSVGDVCRRVYAELEAARGASRFDGVRRIGIDETSYKKGHKYVTVVVDHVLALPQNQPNAPLYPAGGAPGSRPGALPHFGRPRYLGPPPRARSTAG